MPNAFLKFFLHLHTFLLHLHKHKSFHFNLFKFTIWKSRVSFELCNLKLMWCSLGRVVAKAMFNACGPFVIRKINKGDVDIVVEEFDVGGNFLLNNKYCWIRKLRWWKLFWIVQFKIYFLRTKWLLDGVILKFFHCTIHKTLLTFRLYNPKKKNENFYVYFFINKRYIK